MHGEMIPLEKMEAYGESTARSLSVSGTLRSREILAQLQKTLHSLRRAHDRLHRQTAEGGAAPWLLDNWYLAEREGLEAESAFYAAKRLRRSGDTSLVTAAAAALLSASRGEVDAARCRAFIRGFEKKTVFTRRELMLFPAALRMSSSSLKIWEATPPLCSPCNSYALLSAWDSSRLFQPFSAIKDFLNNKLPLKEAL